MVPTFPRGPRTTDFSNTLSFRKIRKCRVRGPSHIGQSATIYDTGFSTTYPEICTPRMPLKAYIEGRPRISRHLHRDMLPDDATGSVYQGLPVHISRDPDSSLTLRMTEHRGQDRVPRGGRTEERLLGRTEERGTDREKTCRATASPRYRPCRNGGASQTADGTPPRNGHLRGRLPHFRLKRDGTVSSSTPLSPPCPPASGRP